MSSPHIINEENSANNSIISSTMHSLKDNTNNINSSTTNVNTYLPRIYNSSSINNLSSTNPANETSTITSIESSLPRSLLSSKSTTNVIKNRATRALLTHFEPINEIQISLSSSVFFDKCFIYELYLSKHSFCILSRDIFNEHKV